MAAAMSMLPNHYERAMLAITLSLLTGIGGHFINRRWDKGLLFLALIPGWFLIVYLGMLLAVNLGNVAMSMEESDLPALLALASSVSLYGCIAFYALSVVMTIWDARRHETTFRPNWTKTGVIGVAMVSFATFALMLYTVTMMWVFNTDEASAPRIERHAASKLPKFTQHPFWYDESFGGMRGDVDATTPPAGNGQLRLRFSYDGAPAEGVEFKLWLDGKYESNTLMTDENGLARLSLPAGKVYLNRLNISAWRDSPAEQEFVVRTGREQKFDLENYGKYPWYKSKGLEVTAAAEDSDVAMEFMLVPKVSLVWPRQSEEKATVKHDEGVIQWSPTKGATTYLLRIMSIERHGNSTSSHHVVERKVVGRSSLPLAEIPAVKSDGSAPEYSVSVTAFAEDDSYLTESAGSFEGGTFVLADNLALAEDAYRAGDGRAFSAEDYFQRRNDKQRLEVSHGLIKEERYELASDLLATVSALSRTGEWHALQGQMLAKQGRCAEAKALLDKAEAFGDCDCFVQQTRKLCESK